MEDKKIIKDKELEKVTGGGGLDSYITLEYCPMCKADRKVGINVDPQGQKELHRCMWDSNHFWFVTLK